MGNILPIQDVTAAGPDDYKKIIYMVLSMVLVVFLILGYFSTIAWGSEMRTPIITDQLPDGFIS